MISRAILPLALLVVACDEVAPPNVMTVAADASASVSTATPSIVDFNRDVRPILADRCFPCHGPDEGAAAGRVKGRGESRGRPAGLRLDTADGAIALLKSGRHAIVPHNLAQSEAARRIESLDPDEIMPPPELKRPLNPEERAVLLRWIEQGAVYQPHWAFVAPTRAGDALDFAKRANTSESSGENATWPRDALDEIVLARLTAEHLSPAPAADSIVLLRRASLALTGLAPTTDEVRAFLAECDVDASAAYERRVDAMLASPRAAEHMAVTWLDLARYADTYGYQTDGDSFTWPWRDWLLHALDRNMPYDEFATALIAGDLVPNASIESRVASAFNRLHRMTEEGGSVAEEFRAEGIADRVATFGTTFLGLTLECARCHDHKYDPIATREFYGLAAMFGSIDENGLKPYAIQTSAAPPFVRLSNDEQTQRTMQLQAAVDDARIALENAEKTSDSAFAAWRNQRAHSTTNAITPPLCSAHYPFELLDSISTPNTVASGKPATTERHRGDQLGEVTLGDGVVGQSMHFDGDGGVWLDGIAGFTRHDPVSISMWIRPSELNTRATIVHASGFYALDADASGLELLIDHGVLRWSAIHLWPGSAASVQMRAPLELNRWTHLVVTYDGSSSASGLSIYIAGELVDTEVLRDSLDGPLTTHTLEVGSRSRDSGFRSGAIDELRVFPSTLSALQVMQVAHDDSAITQVEFDRTRESDALLRQHFVDTLHTPITDARIELRSTQRALAAHLETIPALMCMEDSPRAPKTFVLQRGAYDQPDLAQPVSPGAIAAVFPFDNDRPRNRLGLAQWLCDARHPLTARVQVNRLWSQVFGRGLVESNENFGIQGSSPSSALLLDALAFDFCNGDGTASSAWNSKHLLKRLVMSATFAQSSVATEELLTRDPHNDLLARGPRMRLTAEMLRDNALLASGLLIEKLGGPSVKPIQQAGLASAAGQSGDYQASTGDDAHRRSVYTYRKRTVPPPGMSAFDAGSREACQPRRLITNTPLQSLIVLNDPVFSECALALATRVVERATDASRVVASEAADDVAHHDAIDALINDAFAFACTRSARLAELAALRTLFAQEHASFSADSDACVRVARIDDPTLAALTLVCSTILASDGAMMSR